MKLWNKEQRLLLGIGDKEQKLLQVLAQGGVSNTSVVAKEAKIPRVTTLRVLSGLSQRGLVSRRVRGREVLWSALPPPSIEANFMELFAGSVAVSPATPLSEVGSLTVFRGMEGIMETNRRILDAKIGERFLAIEPNGIWKYVKQSPQDAWTHLNKLFRQKNILVEMIAEEGFEKYLEETDPEMRRTFLDLIADIRVVPERLLDSATEILIFRDQIFFIDWAHEVAVEIKNPSTMRVMRAMFRVLQDSGRQIALKELR